jgi:hypothetical protein
MAPRAVVVSVAEAVSMEEAYISVFEAELAA